MSIIILSENLEDILLFKKSIKLDFEVLIINDFSEDNTYERAKQLFEKEKSFKVYNNINKGLGGAINLGIEKSTGDKVSIMMADLSDDAKDLLKYNEIMENKKIDAVLGSRFMKNSQVLDYPIQKLILNRIFNLIVSLLFWNKYNDYTNAFKIYKKQALKDIMPLVSESFNIFLEIPLKIISRNYSYEIIPINWYGRKKGKAKFKIKNFNPKYLFTLIYCFIEKNLLNLKK